MVAFFQDHEAFCCPIQMLPMRFRAQLVGVVSLLNFLFTSMRLNHFKPFLQAVFAFCSGTIHGRDGDSRNKAKRNLVLQQQQQKSKK